MEFRNKIIIIISKEDFDGMLMSKQHYAIELSRLDNEVYFINHTDLRQTLKRGDIKVENSSFKNLWIVKHRQYYPYFLKFRFLKLYNILTSWHIKRILKKINKRPDLIWMFDIGNSLPLKYFPSTSRKIYMPVDGPNFTVHEREAVNSAELILSVADEILLQYKDVPVPKYMIGHGVSKLFFNQSPDITRSGLIKVGYSGSLLRSDLDIDLIKKIIIKYPNILFEFWGENDPSKSNVHLLQDVNIEVLEFLNFLKNTSNVRLHGLSNKEELAFGLKRMDILFVFYKPNKDNTKNSHKLLEYFATGNVIISSYLSSYFLHNGNLLEMVTSSENNDDFPFLLEKVLDNLEMYNSLKKQEQRIHFARQYSYENQIFKIEKYFTNCL